MPVMQFRCSHQHTQRSNWQPHIRMNVNRLVTTKREQTVKSCQGKTHKKRWQIDQRHRVDSVDWIHPVCGKPIEMLRTVMNGMKAPQERDAMLQPVAPVYD